MPCLVHPIVYIKPPIAFEYENCSMCSHSAFIEGDNCVENLKWETNWVLISFICSIMSNCCSTFFKYYFLDKLTLPRPLSLHISMLKIFLSLSRFFISNSWLSWIFNFSILSLLLDVINISSTYNTKYVKDPSYSLREYTEWLNLFFYVSLLFYKPMKSLALLPQRLFQFIKRFC